MRVALMDRTSPEIVKEIEAVLERKFLISLLPRILPEWGKKAGGDFE